MRGNQASQNQSQTKQPANGGDLRSALHDPDVRYLAWRHPMALDAVKSGVEMKQLGELEKVLTLSLTMIAFR